MASTSDEKDRKKIERAARERYDRSVGELREGAYRFGSKVRGQASIVLEELIDPDGETVMCLADAEGDAGALSLATPIDLLTFETWLFGQIGDKEQLDIETESHWETWFNYGAWIGEALRRRHGGHWLIAGDEPKSWRLGFSKIMLEIAPFLFAEQLLRMGSGAAHKMVAEIDRLRELHEERKEKDDGEELDRFTAEHYIRLHTMPLGQWLVLDFGALTRLWNRAPVSDLGKEVAKQAKRLGAGNVAVVEKVVEALAKADQTKPISQQTGDRGLFEAVAQIIALRRASAPVAIDVMEKYVLPTMHIGIPEGFPPLDEDDLSSLRKGIELFGLYVEAVPHKHQADDEGFLSAIPHDQLSTPYGDRTELEIAKGDWVIVDPKNFKRMLLEFDSNRLLTKYDEFVAYVRSNPKAPRRRDDGRMLAETVATTLADMKACVVASSKEGHSLLFRMLPPPAERARLEIFVVERGVEGVGQALLLGRRHRGSLECVVGLFDHGEHARLIQRERRLIGVQPIVELLGEAPLAGFAAARLHSRERISVSPIRHRAKAHLELGAKVVHRLVANIRILGHRFSNQQVRLLGDLEMGRELASRRRRMRDLHGQHLGRRLGFERRAAAQHVEQDHADRVDVRAMIDLLAARGLGRHVLGRSEHGAGEGLAAHQLIGREHLGDAEVEDLDEVVDLLALDDELAGGRLLGDLLVHLPNDVSTARLADHHDVIGLQVAMDDELFVRRRERQRNLVGDVERAMQCDGALLLDQVLEARPVEVLHDEVDPAVGHGAEVGDVDDVGVVDRRRGAGFAQESCDRLLELGKLKVEDFYCDLLADVHVLAAVHRAHTAPAQDLVQVVVPDRGADAVDIGLLHEDRGVVTAESLGRGEPLAAARAYTHQPPICATARTGAASANRRGSPDPPPSGCRT